MRTCVFFRYAGALFGVTNTFATLPGMIAPTVVGAITTTVSYSQILEKKLKTYAINRVAAGARLPKPWLFEPAKRPADRADYSLGCSFLPSANTNSFSHLSGVRKNGEWLKLSIISPGILHSILYRLESYTIQWSVNLQKTQHDFFESAPSGWVSEHHNLIFINIISLLRKLHIMIINYLNNYYPNYFYLIWTR